MSRLEKIILEEVRKMNDDGEIACLKSLHARIPNYAKLTIFRHLKSMTNSGTLHFEFIQSGGRVYKAMYIKAPDTPIICSECNERMRARNDTQQPEQTEGKEHERPDGQRIGDRNDEDPFR
ncbi:MAG: hypothetical protein FWD92_03495 [Methanomassiliicoccaceae archaeon]|nr:hypothetical protein [Methanomassiliicoccaceae archaeon]